jgi:hypothetical protein
VGGRDGTRGAYGDFLRGMAKNRTVAGTHGLPNVGVARDQLGWADGLRRTHLGSEGAVERHRDGHLGRNFKNGDD